MNASGTNKKPMNANQNIQVYVRVRPTNARERGIRSMEVVEVPNSKEVIARQLLDTKTTKKFTFDKAFGPDSEQHEVYSTVVAPLIDEVLAGYNCTVFAYGQTGTGKTFTMVGEEAPELGLSWEDDGPIGIIPRALSHLFDELRALDMEFSMRVSYLELYNEELCDLLSTDDSVKIRIFDDSAKKGSVIVQGLEEIPVHNKDDVYKLLAKGQDRRRTASTLMNAQSSRSHTVFSILVHIRENGIEGEEMLKIGKLNLVDLAGSENISKAGNEKGIRTRETVNINQSLLTLGRVITALVEKTPHVPYRESKLTRLLQESLGGRTKTSIIATISPGHKDLEETLSTLDYAHRAKNIQNKPEINQRLTKKTVLKEYTEEIDKLKRDLMAARDKNGVYLATETYDDMVFKIESSNKELTEKQDKIKALKEELAKQTRLFDEVSYNLIERTEELVRTDAILRTTEADLEIKRRNLKRAKKRYEEKKIVLSHHMRTEEALTSQARDLISAAEQASKDSSKLHDTIDRRICAEKRLESSCFSFSEQLQRDLTLMHETLAQFGENYSAKSKMISSEIKNFSQDNISLIQEFLEVLKLAHTFNNEGQKTLQEQILEAQTAMQNDVQTAFSDGKKFHEEIVKQAQEKATGIQHIIEFGLETFEKQLEHMSATQQVIIENVRARDEQFQVFTAELKLKLNAVLNHAESIEAEQKSVNELFSKIQDNFNSLVPHFGKIQDHKSILTQETKAAHVCVDKFVASNDVKEHEELNANMVTEMDDMRGTSERNVTKVISGLGALKLSVESETNEFVKQNRSLLNQMGSQLEENLKKAKKTNENSNMEISKSLKHLNSVIEKVKNKTTNHVTNAESLVSTAKKLASSATADLQTHIRCTSDSTETFRRKEVKTYVATGDTPGRKEYKIVRDLAQTSPHEHIVRNFRLEYNSADTTVTELDPDCSMLNESLTENSMIVINSTPFKDCVTERKNLSDPHLSQILSLTAISEENKENF